MKFKVCPRCGSRNIFAGKMSSGILFGVSSWMEECRDCGFKGSPIIFDSDKEYLLFLKHLHSDYDDGELINNSDNVDGTINIDEIDNIDVLNDDQWHHGKWWVEIIVAALLAAFFSTTSALRNMSLFGLGVGAVYSVLEFIIFFIFILIGIIILKYLGYLIYKKI